MRKLISFILCVAVLAGYGAEYAESRLHSKLRFSGKPLPDVWQPDSRQAPRVALYVGRGTWETGKEHLKMFLKEHGFSYRTLSAEEILQGALSTSGVGLLIMPGGQSWVYLSELGEKGADAIRRFVSEGGGYLGICAGAFYATSKRKGGPVTGPYGIGLLDGTAYDGTSLGTAPFKEGMLDFDMAGASEPLLKGLKNRYRSVLLGGPSFRYDKDEANLKDIHVLGWFQQIHEPALILFHYGEGRVFLSAPHGEIEEDRTNWGPDFYDPESEWPIWDRVTHYLLQD